MSTIASQRRRRSVIRFAALLALVASTHAAARPAPPVTVSFVSNRDTTLIESSPSEWSAGASPQFYVGRVGPNGGGTLRRGIVRFPVESIPAGSTITSVTTKLYMSKANGGAVNISFKRCTSDWGEGASSSFGGGGAPPEPNDVTWTKRFFPGVAWSTPGGDFVSTASVTKSVSALGWQTFGSTAGLVDDVQDWVDGTASNFGWVVTGNETTTQTAKRFEARESQSAAFRPSITIIYQPPAIPGDTNGDDLVNGADIAVVLGAWGACSGCAADLDGNGVVDGADLAIVLGNWSP